MPIIPALGRLRQREDHGFESTSRPVWVHRPCRKQRNKIRTPPSKLLSTTQNKRICTWHYKVHYVEGIAYLHASSPGHHVYQASILPLRMYTQLRTLQLKCVTEKTFCPKSSFLRLSAHAFVKGVFYCRLRSQGLRAWLLPLKKSLMKQMNSCVCPLENGNSH